MDFELAKTDTKNLYSYNKYNTVLFYVQKEENTNYYGELREGTAYFFKQGENLEKAFDQIEYSPYINKQSYLPRYQVFFQSSYFSLPKTLPADFVTSAPAPKTGGFKSKQMSKSKRISKVQTHVYNGKSYTVNIGSRGGLYIVVSGEKKYIKAAVPQQVVRSRK